MISAIPVISGQEEEMEGDICLVGIGRLDYHESPKELMPMVDLTMQQWITRHTMEGKITFSDPRYVYWEGSIGRAVNILRLCRNPWISSRFWIKISRFFWL